MSHSSIIIIIMISLFFISPTNEKEKINKILSFNTSTILRGIAILLVILQHLGGSFGTNLLTPLGGAYSGGYPFSISGDIRSVPS